MASKGLEVPVSKSEKLDASVLGHRFTEKAEHLPIKKRRFLFMTSSPPRNTAPSEVSESVATFLDSSSQKVHPKPDASIPPAASLTMADLRQSGSIDNKVDGEKFVTASKKASDNKATCGISLGSGIGIKSLKPPATIKLEANSVNLPNISAKETGLHLHISTLPSKDVASSIMHSSSTPDNQVTNEALKSAVSDERLNWDLNTVMAWEESPECDYNIFTTHADGKNRCKDANSKGCKQEPESASENIGNKILTDLRSLTEPEERKPNSNDINKLLFPVISSAPHVTVNNIKHLDSSTNGVPSIVKLEYPACDISRKQVNNDLGTPMTAGTGLSLDYSIPPGFNHSINTRPLEENVNVKHAITALVQPTENENLNLSLVTIASLENEVHQSGTTFEEDDKAKVKRVITSNGIKMENLTEKPIKPEKSPVTPSVDNGLGFENFPSDLQGSEVDNVEEFSVGYDSQFEDGEVRESSIQTWEGSEGDDRENEHETNNKATRNFNKNESRCVPESSSRIRSTEIGSQKGTDEISSVLLPENPDTSEHLSNPEPRNDTREEVSMNMKDETESNQWKMNVSGSDDYTNIRDFTTIKYHRKEPSTRDAFLNRGSRFRMQGYSSSNGDDSVSRSRESGVVRSFRRGNSNSKHSPHVRISNRGGATWNRSPGRDRELHFSGPTFRDVDNLTNEVCLDQNGDLRPGDPSYPTRQSFRTRLVGNREEDDFRTRLGLRPAGDTRFRGGGRSLRYGSRGGGPRGRFGGPAHNGFDEPFEYSHSFPRRRCFSPTERRENQNHPCAHHHSGSTSPPRSRTRSRSPRIRRPRSPGYRFEADGYNNNSPTRWVKYKQRSTVFNRSPPPPIGERLTFYDSSRKTKQNENYRSGHPGRFSEVNGGVMDHGYRRGGGFGFVKRHEIGRPVKHIEYEEEVGYGLVEGMEFHGQGRFRDLPTRPREE